MYLSYFNFLVTLEAGLRIGVEAGSDWAKIPIPCPCKALYKAHISTAKINVHSCEWNSLPGVPGGDGVGGPAGHLLLEFWPRERIRRGRPKAWVQALQSRS